MSSTLDSQRRMVNLDTAEFVPYGLQGSVQSDRLCCKPDVGVSQIRTTTVLSSCFCVGQTVL